jgi:hypothetical protein
VEQAIRAALTPEAERYIFRVMDDVFKVIANPIYAGIGPYPATMSEDEWLQANAQLIKKYGARKVLRAMLANMREAFPSDDDGSTSKT